LYRASELAKVAPILSIRVNRVADFEQKDKRLKEHSAKRCAYIAPNLKVFGSVGELTQSGTGAKGEQTPGQGSAKKRP
jgi:hypothetical protein